MRFSSLDAWKRCLLFKKGVKVVFSYIFSDLFFVFLPCIFGISLEFIRSFFCRYIPTYSTRLEYESGSWKLLPPNSSDPMGVVDPVWTESNWDVIGLRVYTMQDTTYDRLILLAGLGITGFSYFAIEVTKAIIAKSLKRD